jgi:3'(2'), 5'-bisphosphate nucleotidase
MIENLSQIVKEVGALLLKWRAEGIREGVWDGSQFKARADRMAHTALSERLRALSPELPILSEEDESSQIVTRPERYWLIDPIDGTASFVQGYDGFVTQAALMQDGEPCLAAIQAPAIALTYIAERGKGSYCNRERLALAGSGKLDVLIDNYPEPRGITGAAYTDLGFSRYIECGSISLKICRVADGTADLFFKDVMVKDWDLAAPQLVLSEAGGVMKDIHGCEVSYCQDYNHEGLIAAASEEACRRLVNWYYSYQKGNSPL